MLQLIKKMLPVHIARLLRQLKIKTIDHYKKEHAAKKMGKEHPRLLAKLSDKKKIRVVFLAIHASVWKVDSVFIRMQEDPYFDVEILVCPYINSGIEAMHEEMERTYAFFMERGYPVRKSLKQEGTWTLLEELDPDIVFFTNPHNVTISEYYELAYFSYLTCYVPYHHEVVSYDGDIDQYDQVFHNAIWRIFAPHKYSLETYENKSHRKGKNVHVAGYPMMELLFSDFGEVTAQDDAWKNCDERLRIIWAPHHTIDSAELPYSNFLKYAERIKDLAVQHQGSIVWSFKPHPVLKAKLYDHRQWGKERTDAFYNFWEGQEFTQLDIGEYVNLFKQSDALVHDSGSFLAEYLYFRKPVLYLMSKNNNMSFFNEFGERALASCRLAEEFIDIESFVDGLLSRDAGGITELHEEFIGEELLTYFQPLLPSERVLLDIKKSLAA
jgi:hypothetical protein